VTPLSLPPLFLGIKFRGEGTIEESTCGFQFTKIQSLVCLHHGLKGKEKRWVAGRVGAEGLNLASKVKRLDKLCACVLLQLLLLLLLLLLGPS
jgi:hypothetical protein